MYLEETEFLWLSDTNLFRFYTLFVPATVQNSTIILCQRHMFWTKLGVAMGHYFFFLFLFFFFPVFLYGRIRLIMIIIIGLDGWVKPFQAGFFLEITPTPLPGWYVNQIQRKVPQTHSKANIEPKGNGVYWKLAYFKVFPLTFSKSSKFSNFPSLLQKYFRETKLSIVLSIYFISSINLSLCSYL